ncbi:hypothetical protein BGX27_003382, partial [Mortierella sp. AM989]
GVTALIKVQRQTKKALKKYVESSNGFDNALVAELTDPAINCKHFKAPSLMEPGVMHGSIALNQLHASLQAAPIALISTIGPMVLSYDQLSIRKLNAYRKQHLARHLSQATAKVYYTYYDKVAPGYIKSISKQIIERPPPMSDVANNLFTFMGQRYAASRTNLGCDKVLKKTSAITVSVDKKGVTIKVAFW